ncbi:MAG: hypothetical protein ABIA63_02315 [bacterium]
MKLFKLVWEVKDGINDYGKTDIRVFKNISEAEKIGIMEEYESNTDRTIKEKPTEKQREKAQDTACNKYGRIYQFMYAEEFKSVSGIHGTYEIILGRRII